MIEYRAWDKEGNNYSNWKPQMIYADNWAIATETKGSILNPCIKTNRFIFEQYTELKDKNDKKIFKGDRVSTGVRDGIVIFVNGAWRIDCYTKHQLKESCSMLWQHRAGIKKIRDIKIIGTIHE